MTYIVRVADSIAARSKSWVCRSTLAEIMGAWMSVCCVVYCQVQVSATG